MLNLYVSAGTGFETPTSAELAYRPDGASGLNLDLRASRSRNVEVGFKWMATDTTRINLAVLKAVSPERSCPRPTRGEGHVPECVGHAAARTGGFRGFSFRPQSCSLRFLHLSGRNIPDAYTYRPTVSPQTVTVDTGNFLPGVPWNTAYAELTWRRGRPGFSAAVEALYRDRVFPNDINTETASQYALANIRFMYSHRFGGWKFSEFVRVDNVTGTKYEGSVIVNESNGRFYEPAPGRNYMVGVSASYIF